MAESSEVELLRKKIGELEQQLVEERETFEWDLKAAKESAEATIKKLEQQLAEAQKGAPKPAGGGDTELLQRRAMMAERKVAELQAELQRTITAKAERPTAGDSFLRQRAEQAEKEREDLRREKRALERKLEEMENQLKARQQDLEKAQSLKIELERLREELLAKDREMKKLERSSAEAQSESDQVKELKDKLEQAQKRAEEQAQRAAQLEQEINRTKMASGQMLEQREREAMRLQSDLQELEFQKQQNEQNIRLARQESEKFKHEADALRRERDRLLLELERLRESQVTKITAPASPPAKDQFEEKTVKTSQPAGASIATVKDGRPLGAACGDGPGGAAAAAGESASPPPVDDQTTPAEEDVIVGQLLTEKESQEPLGLDRPAEPAQASPQENKFGLTGTQIVREKEQRAHPPMAAPRKLLPLAGRRWLLPAAIVLLVVAVVAVALWKFPLWFGISGVEKSEVAGTDQRADAEKADAGAATQASADAGQVETGEPAQVPQQPDVAQAGQAIDFNTAVQEIKNFIGSKRYGEALDAAAKLVEGAPEKALAHHLYGRALFYKGEYKRSLEELRRSLELDANLRDSHYEMIGVCLRIGDKAGACQAAKNFVRLSPPRDKRAEGIARNLKKWGCR